MNVLLRVAVAILLAAAFADVALAAENCEPQKVADVELLTLPDGSVFMPASVNGHDVYFALSIGAGLPLILESALEPLGLKAKPRIGGGEISIAGQRITRYAMLEKLIVGDYRFLDRAAPLIPRVDTGWPAELNGKPVVGRMGSTLIQRVDAEIHLAEHRLRLFKSFRCRDRSPVYWEGPVAEMPMRFDEAQTLVFTLELEGKRIESSLLNGSLVSTIDANVTREFFGFDETSPGVGAGVFHAMSLTGHDLTLADVPVRLLTGSPCKVTGSVAVHRAIGYASCVNAVPFNIGTDLLTRMRVYIASERARVYVSIVGQAQPGERGSISIAPR